MASDTLTATVFDADVHRYSKQIRSQRSAPLQEDLKHLHQQEAALQSSEQLRPPRIQQQARLQAELQKCEEVLSQMGSRKE